MACNGAGTHDNQTAVGWWKRGATPYERNLIRWVGGIYPGGGYLPRGWVGGWLSATLLWTRGFTHYECNLAGNPIWWVHAWLGAEWQLEWASSRYELGSSLVAVVQLRR